MFLESGSPAALNVALDAFIDKNVSEFVSGYTDIELGL
jgi:hypothetical protein